MSITSVTTFKDGTTIQGHPADILISHKYGDTYNVYFNLLSDQSRKEVLKYAKGLNPDQKELFEKKLFGNEK